jgi:hypothetical protein
MLCALMGACWHCIVRGTRAKDMPEDALLSRLVNSPPSTHPGSSTGHALSGLLPLRAADVISTFLSQFRLHHDGIIFYFTSLQSQVVGYNLSELISLSTSYCKTMQASRILQINARRTLNSRKTTPQLVLQYPVPETAISSTQAILHA